MKLSPIEVAALSDGKDPSQVQKLNASNKGIDEVVGLEACTSLTRLDASGNILTAVDGIAACPALRWLSVAKNQVTSLDPLRDQEGLEVLNAAHNSLEGKIAVGRLRALKALILNNNKDITSVGGLEKLKELDTLVLSHNAVSSLGGWLAGAERLQKLSASHNPLTDIGTALRSCPQLQELRLNHCQLTSLPESLSENSRLRILEVGSNQISNFEDLEILRQLPALRQLNLKGCPVAELPGYEDKVKEMVPRLEVLDSKRLQGGKGGHKQPRHVSANPFDQAMAAGASAGAPQAAGERAPAQARPQEADDEHIDDTKVVKGSKRERDGAEQRAAGDESGKDKNVEYKEERKAKKDRKEKGEKRIQTANAVATIVDNDDDAMDPAELKKAPKKKKKLDGDAQRTGAVKVSEVGKKGKDKGKTTSKGGKQQTKGTLKEGDANKKDVKTALRGAAAIQALLSAPAGRTDAEELPGWD